MNAWPSECEARRLYITDVPLMAAPGKVRAYIVFMMQMDINIRGDICDIDYSLMIETANKNTGYTQKNGAVSLYSPLKPYHSFVYTCIYKLLERS